MPAAIALDSCVIEIWNTPLRWSNRVPMVFLIRLSATSCFRSGLPERGEKTLP